MFRLPLHSVSILALFSVLVFSFGCQKTEQTERPPSTSQTPGSGSTSGESRTPAAHTDHEGEFHSHDHGPQGGILAILGAHQFHVEFMPDVQTGTTTAFVYDSRFKPTVLDSKELALNIMVDGQPKQYTFLVDHDGSDNKAATFKLSDEGVTKLLKDGWTGDARVSITVKGNPAGGNLVPLKK